MTYSGSAVGLFRYIHSNPPGKSAAILRSVLRALDEQLYRPTARPADPEKIEEYLNKKMDANLEKIRDARILKELWNYDRIWINGRSYRNLKELGCLFDHNALRTLFAADPVADIHGDLTVENIICRTDVENPDKAWYIIDPNTGNLHDSPYLDYGKLLQSLHGGYEFMMMTPRCTVQENHIDFQLTRSAAYDTLFEAVCDDLRARCGAAGLHSILAHELIHWLRLMPYKLNKDKKRAPMFPSAEDVERVHDLKKQYYAANMDIARKNEALFVILEALRPTHYLAVITTGSRQNATEMLDHFHCTDWFDLILTQEDVVNNKPDPEGYLKAMAHFGVDAAHTMIFEDSAPGLAAARATGASVFACNQF